MFALLNHLTLHYRVDGRLQGTPLVFINSLGCDLRVWEGVIQSFTNQPGIIRYDKRGHGLSDGPPGPHTIRGHTHDLYALLNFLEVNDVLLIGISVGGQIAMDFALQYPSRVLGLVLSDTAPVIGTPELWEERIQAVRERGLAGMAETILSRWFLPEFSQTRPAEYRGYLNMLSRTSPEGYIATCAAIRDADLSGSIGAITAPALALCGAGDRVVSPEQTREWAACLPKAHLEIIKGAAHLPCIEQPEAMANAIGEFLRKDCHV